MKIALLLLAVLAYASGQRITTIQLDGVQYFVSRMNPYSPELNYFLAYQYCRSLGLQLASFETKEKADTLTQYLKNAGYTKYDFWTSGNKLGTDMFLWMSTGLPFNATFDYMLRRPGNAHADVPPGTEPQRVARESGDSGSADGCMAMMAPTLHWEPQDCTLVKDFICEQTRCYYYNYGSIPVSATQGNRRPYVTTTTSRPAMTTISESGNDERETDEPKNEESEIPEDKATPAEAEAGQQREKLPEDPVVGMLYTTASPVPVQEEPSKSEDSSSSSSSASSSSLSGVDVADHGRSTETRLDDARPEHIPDIASLFTESPDGGASPSRPGNVFEGLETREVLRTASRSVSPELRPEHREAQPVLSDDDNADDADLPAETELPNNGLEDARTVGPYDTVQDYVNDQPQVGEQAGPSIVNDQDDDTSTILPEAEPAYRYNIKVRTNGKVLDPPSK